MTSDLVWKELLCDVAQANTNIFNDVFPYMPQNLITTMEEYRHREKLPPRNESKLSQINGHLIMFPLYCLSESASELRHALSDEIFQ